MTTAAIELFYSYAHEDEALRDQLNDHLSLLQHQGYIQGWYDRDISAGGLWADEIDKHLETAQIILLLVSSPFLASKYCYGVEMQKALARHEAGQATVIPIILRPCDWEDAPFGRLQALPKDAKPITLWPNRDAAFTDVAKGIRKIIRETSEGSSSGASQDGYTGRKGTKKKVGVVEVDLPSIPVTPVLPVHSDSLNTSVLKKAIDRYYKELKGYEGLADHELALRSAFQNLLANTAHYIGLTLIPEQTIEDGIRPDGVLRDASNLRRGYWEAKGPESDLDREIDNKIAKGYPLDNTIFENTKHAVLYQGKRRVFDCSLLNTDDELVKLLQNKNVRAHKDRNKDAKNALIAARNHLGSSSKRKEMYLSITEAKIYLVAKEYDESAITAKRALDFARKAHSQQGIEEIKQIYSMLHQLEPKNPYIANLGVELGIFLA